MASTSAQTHAVLVLLPIREKRSDRHLALPHLHRDQLVCLTLQQHEFYTCLEDSLSILSQKNKVLRQLRPATIATLGSRNKGVPSHLPFPLCAYYPGSFQEP